MHLMTDFKFERSLSDLFCDFAEDILNFIVCANKQATLPQFQDEMIRFSSTVRPTHNSHFTFYSEKQAIA